MSAIHPQTKQVLRTFQVGQAPTEMALTGTHLYVANSGGNSVSMINLDTNTVSAPISVGTNPTGLAVSPDGKWVYVANQGSNTVSVINAATNTIVGSPIAVGSQPTSVVISADSSLAYVANSDDTVAVIDIRTNTVVRTVAIDPNPEIGSHSMALSQGYSYPFRDDDRIYVTDAADRTMRALAITPSPAPQLPATTTPITVGSSPGDAAVVGSYAYVLDTSSSTISRIDTTTNTVVGPRSRSDHVGRQRSRPVQTRSVSTSPTITTTRFTRSTRVPIRSLVLSTSTSHNMSTRSGGMA